MIRECMIRLPFWSVRFFSLRPRHVAMCCSLAPMTRPPSLISAKQSLSHLPNFLSHRFAVVGGALLPGSAKKPPQSGVEISLWRTHAQRVNNHVWRLPGWLFCDRLAQEFCEQRRPPTEFRKVFEYFLFSAKPGKSELAIFSTMSDAAVLVVTANRTRRDSALHAKEQLARYKVPLLGTVLNDRRFEIPEAIYRRL
jgi:hypothetical protein